MTPIKDVGFPYRSHIEFGEAGEAIDAALGPVHLAAVHDQQPSLRALGRRRLAAGAPPRLRRVPDLGALAGDRGGRRTCARGSPQVTLDEGGRALGGRGRRGRRAPRGTPAAALVLTGPGIHRAFPHEPAVASRRLPLRQQARGVRPHPRGGAVRRRDRRRRRERAQRDDVPARAAAPLPLHDLHADAADEPRRELPREPRLLQSRRGRMGVARPADAARLRQALRPRRLRPAEPVGDRLRRPLSLRHRSGHRRRRGGERRGGAASSTSRPKAPSSSEHDYVANCTGFDLLAQLRTLFPAAMREEIERQVGPLWDQPAGTEVPIGRNLELRGHAAAPAHPRPGGAEPGPGLRQPRRPRPALQPRPAAAPSGSITPVR